jgi:hypothetical protein
VKILSIMMLDSASLHPPSETDMQRMGAFIEELKGKGALVDTGGAMDGMLELQVARKGGDYSVVDGPFSEAKEVVGGYALLDVADREEAIALTRRFLDIIGDATCHLHEVSSP